MQHITVCNLYIAFYYYDQYGHAQFAYIAALHRPECDLIHYLFSFLSSVKIITKLNQDNVMMSCCRQACRQVALRVCVCVGGGGGGGGGAARYICRWHIGNA